MDAKDSENLRDKKKSGPKSESVTIKQQWEDAVEIALQKKKPVEGWPKG